MMNTIFDAFLNKLTIRRQLGIAVALGIFLLALLSSVAGSWQGRELVRSNLIEQGRHITESLARQSALALVLFSADNVIDAVNTTLNFPGVVSVEIHDSKQYLLLKRGNIATAEFPVQAGQPNGTGKTGGAPSIAVLDAESPNAWRFVAPVYAQSANSPFDEAKTPELLGRVTVVISKSALSEMSTGIFISNMASSFAFALLFLVLIRFLTNRMTRPLNQLSVCMGRAEAGESQVRAEQAGPKDIADMAHAFNNMMLVLEERAAEIHELNTELEGRVRERTAQLEAANKELEAFAYSVSHDLRTPLRAIDGFSHILLDDYTDKLDAEGKRLLNVVRDSTCRMGQLIDDILQFSRTGRLEMVFVDIDMEGLARSVVGELQPFAAGDKLQVDIEPIPHSTGDRAMMRQVFVNLLSNAMKFSRAREPAMIRVGGSIEGEEAVYFVSDNGAGFDMQYVDRLFGVFQRLHAMSEFEGTGIGLAIVKRIITRHGGRVWAVGKVDEGATIYFALPTRQSGQG